MLDEIMLQGRILLQKVRKHYFQDPTSLPLDQQVTVAEVEGWYKGVDKALQQLFGENSSEVKIWREALADSRKRSWDAVYRGDKPTGESWVVHLLAESLGTLAEIKLVTLQPRTTTIASISLNALHPRIVEKCRSLYESGEYDSAVFIAFRTVEEELRLKTNAFATDIGVALVSAVLGQKNPKLCVSDIPAEQDSIHALFRGALGAFKNPLSHRSLGHSDPTRVFELLALASLLLRIVDEAQILAT